MRSVPVPLAGSVPSPIGVAVVGDFPDAESEKRGKPFVGPAGRLLCESLRSSGINPSECTFLYAVSCRPRTAEGRPRLAYNDELDACTPNLALQLKAAGARWTLIAGNTALRRFTPIPMTQAHGRPFDLKRERSDGPTGFAVYNPDAVLRSPQLKATFDEDIQRFAQIVAAGRWSLPDTCIVCAVEADPLMCDDRGFTFCVEHHLA
ncbi:MAG TPA: uracil-DNA glycosylase family protein [Fimbriimonadaceae bacterium]|nr:uracil-DNA glycosylase family protein [Fimbriimonadaceae bacterium]